MPKKDILSRKSEMQRLDTVRPARDEPTLFDGVDLRQLKPKMKRFARRYLELYNVAAAAEEAGYTPASGYRLFKRDDVQAYMRMLIDASGEEGIASAVDVLKYLSDVMIGNIDEQVVLPTGEKVNKRADLKDRTAAANLLGKFHGTFTERVEIQNEYNIVVDIDESFKGLLDQEEVEDVTDSLSVDAEFSEVPDESANAFLDQY